MRTNTCFSILVAACFAAWCATIIAAHDPAQHQEGAHHHPQAAKLQNPVPATDESIAAGRAIYVKRCAECHGDHGKGDGDMADMSNPKPADLSDADWKHGSTDGEIFTVVRDGVKNTDMKPFGTKLTTHQLWDVVNFVRSLGPKAGTPH